MLRVLTPEICRRSEYALTPLKCRILSKLLLDNCKFHVIKNEQEAQLMLTTGSTRLAVSRGQQTWYHSTCYI